MEVDAAALRQNLQVLRSVVTPGAGMAAVVKANAYGHGLDQVAPLAAKEAEWLAVHSAAEARRIRELGLKLPVLVMGFVSPGELFDLDQDVHLLVSTPESLGWLGEYRRRSGVALPVHLKVETGTHRQGVDVDSLPVLCRAAAAEGLEVVGLATHFANIEDTLEHDFARSQLDRFHRAEEAVRRELGGRPPFLHAACSAAALLFREADFSMVRVGISMYGHWPSRETQLSWILDHGRDGVRLEPVLTWVAQVGQVKEVPPGATVGYGRTWEALRTTRLAVLPVGYSDGYPRALGNRATVLIRGERARVVGRVCMNITMVDVTDIEGVEVGDDVVLLGKQGGFAVTAEELGALAGTINYELLARLAPHVPRVVVNA